MTSPRELLKKHRLRPKHSWGQNFLGDDQLLGRIAAAAELRAGDPVVELGPGLGHLTAHLAATGARVVAVERDPDMIRVLQGQALANVQVVSQDAAHVQFADLARAPDVTVVGNLPYHLSSVVLFEVLDQREHVRTAVFTLQKEVVIRLAAPPGNRDYGILSALLQLGFEVERLFDIPASYFHPPPKVDSSVVRLRRLSEPLAPVRSAERYRRVVKAAFAQRRKTILNSMRSDAKLATSDQLKRALEAAGIDATRRGETLSVVEFAALERALADLV